MLEEAILAFDGCALLVSHDRYFLNRLATHMIVFEGNGQVYVSPGNYDDYLRFSRERDRQTPDTRRAPERTQSPAPAAAAGPKRLSYMEKRELEGMEQAIESAEAEIARLEEHINRPDFYQRDRSEVQRVLDALEAARERADALYARWEVLEARAAIR